MIIFSDNALAKLSQRNIPKSKVLEALKRPDQIFSSISDRKVAYKKIRKLYLKVVFIKEGSNIVVITQYWTDKIQNN